MTTTRERIIREAMHLFAERGYKATTVAAIEEAAGLSPGSGALYKHFRSKEEVLSAGIGSYLARIEGLRDMAEAVPTTDDPAADLRFAAHAAMAEMAAHGDFNRVLFRELDRFPELLADVRDRSIHATYRSAAETIARQAKDYGVAADLDFEATAVVALGSLLHFRIVELLFGEPPAQVDESRVVDAWVDVWETYISAKTRDHETRSDR